MKTAIMTEFLTEKTDNIYVYVWMGNKNKFPFSQIFKVASAVTSFFIKFMEPFEELNYLFHSYSFALLLIGVFAFLPVFKTILRNNVFIKQCIKYCAQNSCETKKIPKPVVFQLINSNIQDKNIACLKHTLRKLQIMY